MSLSKEQSSIFKFFAKTNKKTNEPDQVESESTKDVSITDKEVQAAGTSGEKRAAMPTSSEKIEDNDCVEPKSKKSKTYSFRSEWKIRRDWLHFDETDKVMYCSICRKFDKSGKSNAFRSGSKCFRLQEIKIHQNSEIHKRSECSEIAEICAQSSSTRVKLPLEQSITKMHEHQTVMLKILFTTAYWLAMNEKPYSDFPKVLELLSIAGVDGVGTNYASDKQAREFISFINEWTMNEIVAEVKQAEFFSVLCDGTTDVSTSEQEIIFIRYVHEGIPKSAFVSLSKVVKADASHIKDAIIDAMHEQLGFDIEELKQSLVGVCFDGASTMMGCTSGVATRIKTLIPHLVAIHCCAHRLELAVKDSAKSIPYMKVIDEVLYNIYSFYKYSASRWEGLQAAAEALNCSLLRPVRVSGCRWLPHHERAIKAVHQSYDAIVTHLENEARVGNADNQEKARIILQVIQSIKFVMFMNFYLTFLNMLSKMSKLFQIDKACLHTVFESVDATCAEIEKMSSGEHLSNTLMQGIEVTETPGDRNQYKGHTLSIPERAQSRTKAKANPESEVANAVFECEKVVNVMQQNLAKRFDIKDNISAGSSILNPEEWPLDPDVLRSYGDNEITEMFTHFQTPLTKKGYTLENVLLQWTAVKKKTLKIRSFEPSLSLFASWQRVSQLPDYGDLMALIRIILALPVNTAICERGFSLMKRVKTDWRSKLSSESLTDLMSIKLNGPQALKDFNADGPVSLWLSKTKRSLRKPYGKRKPPAVVSEPVSSVPTAWCSSDGSDDD